MTMLLSRYAIAALAVVFSSAATAQRSIYDIPGLGGYLQGQQHNQQMQSQQLQQLQMMLQIRQQADQLEQQRQENVRQRQAQIEEIQASARRSIADNAKGVCVAVFVNSSEASEEFARRGTTVGQVCSCMEQEMFALLTLDLSGKILLASRDSAGDNQKFLNSPVGKEWLTRYVSASKVCIGQIAKK